MESELMELEEIEEVDDLWDKSDEDIETIRNTNNNSKKSTVPKQPQDTVKVKKTKSSRDRCRHHRDGQDMETVVDQAGSVSDGSSKSTPDPNSKKVKYFCMTMKVILHKK